MARTLQEGEVLPHPAEDLSADDDLLSWILVDQLGCLPNTKLGVHPQQVKFVGPAFKTSEILSIVQEVSLMAISAGRRLTCIDGGRDQFARSIEALVRVSGGFGPPLLTVSFHLIKGHLETKVTEGQKERFVQ
jgi:histone-lysine N-methyltransferase SUV420H